MCCSGLLTSPPVSSTQSTVQRRQNVVTSGEPPPPRLFCNERHQTQDGGDNPKTQDGFLTMHLKKQLVRLTLTEVFFFCFSLLQYAND